VLYALRYGIFSRMKGLDTGTHILLHRNGKWIRNQVDWYLA